MSLHTARSRRNTSSGQPSALARDNRRRKSFPLMIVFLLLGCSSIIEPLSREVVAEHLAFSMKVRPAARRSSSDRVIPEATMSKAYCYVSSAPRSQRAISRRKLQGRTSVLQPGAFIWA